MTSLFAVQYRGQPTGFVSVSPGGDIRQALRETIRKIPQKIFPASQWPECLEQLAESGHIRTSYRQGDLTDEEIDCIIDRWLTWKLASERFSQALESELEQKSVEPLLKVKLTSPLAVLPSRGTPYASGYDLTLITREKEVLPGVWMYDTGVAVEPPPDHYVEVVPRSSFSKSGHQLANEIGIIDEDYRGSIKVVLRGPNNFALPVKWFQMIVRRRIPVQLVEVAELQETVRGAGGFGSTDQK